MIRFRSDWGVLDEIDSVAIPRARAALIWFVINASRGETTTVIPVAIEAGSWKQRLFPKDVAA